MVNVMPVVENMRHIIGMRECRLLYSYFAALRKYPTALMALGWMRC